MVSPVVAIKEYANRVIEVVRGIEKTQKVTLCAILDSINELLGQRSPTIPVLGQSPVNPDEYMHIHEVEELLHEAEQLRKEVQRKNEEVDRLRSQIEIANKQTPANSPENNQVASIKNALGDIDYFRRAKKITTFNDDIYEFDRSTFE